MANSVYIGWLGPIQFQSDASGAIFPGTLTATRFLGDDGTAAAPSHSFSGTGDGDNGMYLSAADTLGWSAGGTLRLSLSGTALTSTVAFAGTTGAFSGNVGVNGVGLASDTFAVRAANGFGMSLFLDDGSVGAVAGIRRSTLGGRIFARAAHDGSDTIDLSGPNGTGTFSTAVIAPTHYGSTAANGDLILEGTSSATKATSDIALQPNGGTLSTGGVACVATFGPAAVASITVKNGLITAIS
jgi:hypothetical protein